MRISDWSSDVCSSDLDEGEVLAGRERGDEVVTADVDQELQRLRQRVVGQAGTEGEQGEGARHEGDRVAALVVVEARGDDAHDLPEAPRHGEGYAAVAGQLPADAEALARVELPQALGAGEVRQGVVWG